MRIRETSKGRYSIDFEGEILLKNLKIDNIKEFSDFIFNYKDDKESLKKAIKNFLDSNYSEDGLNIGEESGFYDIIEETKDVILRMKNK